MTKYSENAINLFKKLYFKRDKDDNIVESDPVQVFDRVAKGVSSALKDPEFWYDTFLSIMHDGYFRPCTPCMMNVGVHTNPQTAACFVGNLQDSLHSIFDFDRESGLIFAKGSGIGGNFGMLREEQALLSTGGRSSGPFAFLRKWAATADAVKSGGTSRRAAEMCMFTDTHPDLLKFITVKNGEDQEILKSMNLSIAATNKFMEAVINDEDWNLVGVKDGKIKSTHKAKDIYNKITQNAFNTGDPGLWFTDHANDTNGLIKQYGRMLSTNPCGEISGTAYFACALASINVAKFVEGKKFHWGKFKEIVGYGITFLDAMISISGYPTEDYKNKAQNVRPLGLGIMGLADMLCKMEIPYDSEEAWELSAELTKTLTHTAILTSVELGKQYGSFRDFEENKDGMIQLCEKFGVARSVVTHLRNCNWTTIAPTGSTSISADCSPGMEPLFGITYEKNISDSDEKWIFVNPIFEKKYRHEDWYVEAIEKITENHGSCQGIDCVPEEVQMVWKVAHDIHWKDRIEMQAALQLGISNSISSTINLPKTATVEDIRGIYLTAWKKGLKGITFYRDGALASQPVQFQKEKEIKDVSQCRPKIRAGLTHEVVTGHGKIYITVNKDESGRVLEIFTNGGKNGGVSAANLEAIARLASLALQKGVGVEAIAHTLLGISDGTCVWDKLSIKDTRPAQIISIPDAIAQVLHRFYVKKDEVTEVETIGGCKQEISCEQKEEIRCPDCGGFAYFSEGCINCPSCGSKCG